MTYALHVKQIAKHAPVKMFAHHAKQNMEYTIQQPPQLIVA
jgi:hypothetical protein